MFIESQSHVTRFGTQTGFIKYYKLVAFFYGLQSKSGNSILKT